jgi:acetaldehyde dehydrogenase/alcohol dehydrogenase
MQFYATVTDKYMDMLPFLGIRSRRKESALIAIVKKVKSLTDELDVPTTLEGLGISSSDLKKNMEKLTLYAFEDPSTFQSPRPATLAQCEKLFLYAYEGKDIDF